MQSLRRLKPEKFECYWIVVLICIRRECIGFIFHKIQGQTDSPGLILPKQAYPSPFSLIPFRAIIHSTASHNVGDRGKQIEYSSSFNWINKELSKTPLITLTAWTVLQRDPFYEQRR